MERADFEQKKERTQGMMRVIYDFGMGILWTGVGIVVIWHEKFGLNIKADDLLGKIFGGSCMLYGLFRMYRGYQNLKQRA
jgi:hypothetical protein